MKQKIFYFFGFVIAWLLLETLSFAFWSIKYGQFVSAKKIFSDAFGSTDSFSKTAKTCNWSDHINLHPHLSLYYGPKDNCQINAKNSWGFSGPENGIQKDPNAYTVLLLGSSVAESLVQSTEANGENKLQRALNSKFSSPNGKPFKVITGAIAAANQPTPLFAYILLQSLADAVITLEGYNEQFRLSTRQQLYEPSQAWFDLAQSNSTSRHIWPIAFQSIHLDYSYVLTTLLRTIYQNTNTVKDLNGVYPMVPTDWTQNQHNELYLNQYYILLKNILTLTKSNRQPLHIFLQPSAGIDKPLSPDEAKIVGPEEYYLRYQKILNFFDSKNDLPITNLRSLFKNNPDTLYIDHIHLNDKGIKLLIEEILIQLSKSNPQIWKPKTN